MKLLIGTMNPGKLSEFQRLLADLRVTVLTPGDVGMSTAPEEESTSIDANARLKARYYGKKSGLPTIADDGGFEIDALNGEPGVLSRRWPSAAKAMEGAAMDESTDEELIDYTIARMRGIPSQKRGAQIRTVVILRMPDGTEIEGSGIMRGLVVEQVPQKHRITGFPFRDILWIPERGKLYGEFTETERRQYNHRIIALKPIREYLLQHIAKEEKGRRKTLGEMLSPKT